MLKDSEGADKEPFFRSGAEPMMAKRQFWPALLGEEKPRDMLLLLALLVVMLHIWLFSWLSRPEETVTQAVPLVMEVSMVTISKPTPAAPQPAPPVEKKPPPPKKTPPKPVKKPLPKVVQQAPDFAPFKPEPVPEPQQSTEAASSSSASASSAAATSAPTFTEANYRANYAHNPKPEYPTIAKSRGWQGKVLLRVKVSAEGASDEVVVEQSSGHEMLDDSAVEAVKKWRFIPAKRGDTPVASSVIVPIVFTLRN